MGMLSYAFSLTSVNPVFISSKGWFHHVVLLCFHYQDQVFGELGENGQTVMSHVERERENGSETVQTYTLVPAQMLATIFVKDTPVMVLFHITIVSHFSEQEYCLLVNSLLEGQTLLLYLYDTT